MDNTTLDPGAGGDTIATDDVSGVKYQKVQLVTGAAGATKTLVTGSSGLPVQPVAGSPFPVTDNGGSLTIDDGGGSITVDGSVLVSGSVSVSSSALPAGAATSANQAILIGLVDGVEGLLSTLAGAVSGSEMQVDVLTMPTVTVTASNLDIRDLAFPSDSITAHQGGAWSVTVSSMPTVTVVASNLDIRDISQAQDDILVYANTAKDGSGTGYVPLVDSDGHLQVDVLSGGGGGSSSSLGTTSSVNDTNVSTTLLAANSLRLGATIYNDSDQALYLKLGSSASTTDFTLKMVAGSYFEVPYGYTGIITGIWAADSTGAARVTELT